MMKLGYMMLLGSLSVLTHADGLSKTQQASVEQWIQYFKQQNVGAIINAIEYPLTRPLPLPAITNTQQMQQKFSQVFDTHLQKKIAQSKLSDWSPVGWRGIMFHQGEIWISNVDDDPKAGSKMTAVNYSSQAEQALMKQALAAQKQKLHPSLRSFEHPELLFKTKDYLVRIDEIGGGKYRYAAWKNNQDQSKKPDLVLMNGKLKIEGSVGNHSFEFKSGAYRYYVERHIIGGESDAEASILVEKNGKILMQQEGNIVAY